MTATHNLSFPVVDDEDYNRLILEEALGTRYAVHLAGDAIPLSARLMAVADVYDASIFRRVYKPAFPHEQAIGMIVEERGGDFDPDVADAMLDIADEFNAIARRFSDTQP